MKVLAKNLIFLKKIEILLKSRSFGQKFNFSQKIEILLKNGFCSKSTRNFNRFLKNSVTKLFKTLIEDDLVLPEPDESSRESATANPEISGENICIPETPKCATTRRRAIYKRSESKNERRDRKERLLHAVKSRMKKLDEVAEQRAHLTATFDQKVENVLTRDLLLLSGDRHGPFVGRPR